MKITKRLKINGKDAELDDQLSIMDFMTPGRAILKFRSDNSVSEKGIVELIGQLSDNPASMMVLGYIERVIESKNNYYQVLVRELSSLLNRRLSLNLRHCTAKDVLEKISDLVGAEFVIPDSDWVNEIIPRFQHIGGGYMALDSILKSWHVKHGVWHQQENGKIYIGEYEKSVLGEKIIELPADLIDKLTVTGGTFPLMPRIKPGMQVIIDKRINYISTVEVQQNTMRLKWVTNLWENKLRAIP